MYVVVLTLFCVCKFVSSKLLPKLSSSGPGYFEMSINTLMSRGGSKPGISKDVCPRFDHFTGGRLERHNPVEHSRDIWEELLYAIVLY